MLTAAYDGGVTVWSTADWKKITDQKIGGIADVHFNSDSNKIIAAERYGKISIIELE